MWLVRGADYGIRRPAVLVGKAVKHQPADASLLGLWRTLLLPFLLLCVQQGAFLHSLSHYKPVQTQEADHKQTAGGACELCLAFAQLDAVSTPQVQPMSACRCGFAVPSATRLLTWAALAPPEQSRGPPDFL